MEPSDDSPPQERCRRRFVVFRRYSWHPTGTCNSRLPSAREKSALRSSFDRADSVSSGRPAATVDRLEPDARSGEQGPRANALGDLALLGNRGIEPERVVQILLSSVHDSNENVRYWAVEGLAYLGTDETIIAVMLVKSPE